jgi:hypothetical protein
MNYFGAPWSPNIRDNYEQAPTPVDAPCSWCEEVIVAGDQGFVIPCGQVLLDEDKDGVFDKLAPTFRPIHLDCFLREIYGSVGHQTKQCSCHGGTQEDPDGMTKREAAAAAVRLYESQFRGK